MTQADYDNSVFDHVTNIENPMTSIRNFAAGLAMIAETMDEDGRRKARLRYTKKADRARINRAAAEKHRSRTEIGKPETQFAKTASNPLK